MKFTWRDMLSSILLIIGAVIVFARLESYSWWLIGSWGGAVGILGVIGVAIVLSNIQELAGAVDMFSFEETLLWLIAATITIGSLAVTTTRAEFISVAVAISVAWLAQLTHHLWESYRHHNKSGFIHAH